MSESRNKCIECGGESQAIKIIDRGQRNIHYDLIYAAEEAKRSIYSGYKKEGAVRAEMCSNCGRITLRGEAV
jgi:hypothetical protein